MKTHRLLTRNKFHNLYYCEYAAPLGATFLNLGIKSAQDTNLKISYENFFNRPSCRSCLEKNKVRKSPCLRT